jgi:acetyl esterase/lipase
MTQPRGEGPDDESWGDLTAEPREVDYLETVAGGRPAIWAVPKRSSSDRVLLSIHGGGFVSGSIYTHRKMFGHLAKATGARALLVDYRLLPEGGAYPAPVDDVAAAYQWLLDQGTAAGHVAFAGDSVGGWLAITVQLRARDQGLPLPAATMVLSPAVDMEVNGESFATNRD